jgi:hypothetical protein
MKISKNKGILISLLLLVVVACASPTEEQNAAVQISVEVNDKWKGLSFVGNPKPITDSCFDAVTACGANSVTLMPFGFLKDLADPEVK